MFGFGLCHASSSVNQERAEIFLLTDKNSGRLTVKVEYQDVRHNTPLCRPNYIPLFYYTTSLRDSSSGVAFVLGHLAILSMADGQNTVMAVSINRHSGSQTSS